MPAQTRRQSTTSQTQSETTTTQTPDTGLQDSAQDQLKDGGSAAGLANYQSSLGKWLGTELYEALAKELTLASLQEHATSAWKNALESGVEALDGIDGNDKEAGAFATALQEAYGNAASQLLETDTGKKVIAKLNGFVDANPRLILLVALMAAGGAIAANVSLPKFKETFKLGNGFTAKVGADLGKIRDIALKDLSAALEYNSGPLMAAVSINRNEDGEVSGDFKASLGDDAKNLKADGTFTDDGLELYTASGLFTTDGGTKLEGNVTGGADKSTVATGAITTVNGEVTTTNSVKYDSGSGLLSFKNVDMVTLQGGGKLTTEDGSASDGSSFRGMGLSGQVGNNTTGSLGYRETLGADGTQTNSVNGSLNYKTDSLTAGLKGEYDGTNGFVSGSAKGTFAPGLTGSGQFKQTFGDESQFSGSGQLDYTSERWKAGLKGTYTEGEGGSLSANASGQLTDNLTANGSLNHNFGTGNTNGSAGLNFDTPDLKLGGDYSFDTKNDQHKVSGFAQRSFGDNYKARVDGSYMTNNSGNSFEAGGQVYRKINDDLSVFGGGSFKQDEFGGRFIPKAGVEVKGVPLQYSFDPATKQHKVGVTLFKW